MTVSNIIGIIANLATILASGVAFYAIVIKRNEIFRGSIYNRQVDELLSVRKKLQDIWFQIHYVHFWSHNIVSLNRSIDEFAKSQPEDWRTYLDFQDKCKYVYYAFSQAENGLFPKWFKPKEHADLVDAFKDFRPFTLHALSKKNGEEIQDYQNLLLKKISAIDDALNQQT